MAGGANPQMAAQPNSGMSGINYQPMAGSGNRFQSFAPTPMPMSGPRAAQSSQAPTPSNIFGQSAASIGQAQRTMTDLSQFQPQQMQSAAGGPVATYSGATVQSTPLPQAAQVGPMQTYGGAQVGPTAQMNSAQLPSAQTMQGVGAVQSAQAPGQIDVDRLGSMDVEQYMSPYRDQVIQAGQADIERQRQIASENLAGQAQKAGAFGGSRQAVQEGVLAGEALRQSAKLSAEQRQAGFKEAMESGRFDIGNTQSARTLASQQGFQASQLGQQAQEAAAAREQAARSGNMQAANQFAAQQANLQQQANQANQAALNAATAQQAGLTQGAGLASMQAANTGALTQAQLTQGANLASAAQQAGVASQQAGLTQGAGLANQAALNAAQQQQAARDQAANMANYQGQFTGAGIRQGAAGGLGALGQQQFNMGQQVQQQQMMQGALQRGLMNQLIGLGQGGFGQMTGAPQGLQTFLGGVYGAPNMTGQSQSFNPGLFNYMQLGAGMMPR